MDLDAVLASLTISVDAPGATVYLDGREVGPAPLPQVVRLDAGSHVIEARLPGYRDARETVLLREHETVTAQLELVPIDVPRPEIRVESSTAGAVAAIDGALPEPLPFTGAVDPGDHEVRVDAPGHEPETRIVTAPATGLVVMAVDLRPVEPPRIPEENGDQEGGFWAGPWPWIIGGALLLGAGATAGVLLWPDGASVPESDFALRMR